MGFTEILGWVIMIDLALVGFIVMYLMYYMVMGLNDQLPIPITKHLMARALKALNITVIILFALTLLHQFLIT